MNNMTVQDVLTTIGLFLVYSTALVGVYVNLRVKMKEIEIKMLNLQQELSQHKLAIGLNVNSLEKRNTIEHDSIMIKIDNLLEKIIEIRVDQASSNAINIKKKDNL
jgi:hypothetical protein